MPREKKDTRFLASDVLYEIRHEVEDQLYQHCGGNGCNGGAATITLTELLDYIDYLHERLGLPSTTTDAGGTDA
jgi:hypothetical protein